MVAAAITAAETGGPQVQLVPPVLWGPAAVEEKWAVLDRKETRVMLVLWDRKAQPVLKAPKVFLG